MQTHCPQCQQRVAIDDAKVPDRPFSIRCPKCQSIVKLPGRGQAAAPLAPPSEPVEESAPASDAFEMPPPPPPPPPPAIETAVPPSAALAPSDEMRMQMLAQLRREMGGGEAAKSRGQALVALVDRGQAGHVTLALTRQGYGVDSIEDWEEAARLVEQGMYQLVVTTRHSPPSSKGETLYQRIHRFSPDARRRVFLMLVGDDLRTGDGTQAFLLLCDLTLNSRDCGNFDGHLRAVLTERARLYQAYNDARKRHDEASA